MNHRLVNASGLYSAELGQNCGFWYVHACAGVVEKQSRSNELYTVVVLLYCIYIPTVFPWETDLHPFPSRCALYV